MKVDYCVKEALTGDQILDNLLASSVSFKTGLESLDSLLDGGLKNKNLIEVIGPVGVGKTQFALTFCCSILMRIHANARVLYVDTTNAVQPYRIAEILVANNHNFDGEKDLKSYLERFTIVKNVTNAAELLQLLRDLILDQNPNLSLVVIDHIGTLLSPLVQKSVSKANYQILTAARLLKKLARQLNVCVLVVNLMRLDHKRKQFKPCLGQLWCSQPDTTLLFDYCSDYKVEDQATGQILILKSQDLPSAELNEKTVKYVIKCRGTTDIPDSPTQSSDLDL